MRLLTLILAAVLVAPAQSADDLIITGGWFDIKKAPFESQVFAAVATPSHLVIGLSGRGGVEMVMLDSTKFREVARWQLPRKPHYITATSSSVILGYRSGEDAFTACAHTIDGRSLEKCLSATGIPQVFAAVGSRVFAVSSDRLWELDFPQGSGTSYRSVDFIPSDGILLVAGGPETLTRVDSVSLRTSVFNTRNSQEHPATIVSPTLSANRTSRAAQESLVGHVVAGKGEEFWLTHGRYNAYTGLPLDRFSGSGDFLGTIKLQIPQFPDLKRRPTGRSLIGNPTGHLGTGRIVSFGDRILIVDPVALRCAWFRVPHI